MNNPVKKLGGGHTNSVPSRKPHKAMSVEELKAKAEKPFIQKTQETIKDIAKKLGL